MNLRAVPSARRAACAIVLVPTDRVGEVLPAGAAGSGPVPWDHLAGRGFTGKAGDVAAVPDGSTTVVYAGVGAADALDAAAVRRAVASAVRASTRFRSARVELGAVGGALDAAVAGRAAAEGAVLGAYRYVAWKSKPEARALDEVLVVDPGGKAPKAFKDAVAAGQAAAEAACLARDLVNEPGGSLTPPAFAERAAAVATAAGLGCTVHDEKALARLGFGGLLAVNRGSTQPARFVELRYDPPAGGKAAGGAPVALVGKGITFDSGGLSIKTADGMMTMKCDMGGAAAVLGALSACAALGVRVPVRGYLPMTDNMLGGDATRVGDVVRHYGGSTSEVLNTDAEGRLILADAIAYATEKRRNHPAPAAVVDLATLTGACMVALGTKTAGLFSTDDALAERVLAASGESGEPVWRMPLPAVERRRIESKVADRKNTGHRYGGAIHAAFFLSDFVADGVPWAHLDIAGPAFNEEADDGDIAAGGTGFGVRLLLSLLTTWPH